MVSMLASEICNCQERDPDRAASLAKVLRAFAKIAVQAAENLGPSSSGPRRRNRGGNKQPAAAERGEAERRRNEDRRDEWERYQPRR
ncbi:hypothetical protein GPECTOR_369g150 [Gonium pectorale]|uniref:Uncharacterized protein n=1 Tax=Gonium pectorale TaxID=33097 RepID=A0A150FVF4_GONPE|nr:hypothetical protein GPECTOR_369g150 [Gonium pectorale]|eukprot:KXZ41603.1 hypothetical protein GPECTOR_369g150 [Gonium pectorale]